VRDVDFLVSEKNEVIGPRCASRKMAIPAERACFDSENSNVAEKYLR